MWLLAVTSLLAAEAPPPPEDDADVVIDVVAPGEEARKQLEERLEAVGYLRGRVRDDRTVYHHSIPSKPSLHLFHDGRYDLRRGPIRLVLMGQPTLRGSAPGRASLRAFGNGVDFDGIFLSRKRARQGQRAMLTAIQPEIAAWTDELSEAARQRYLAVELPQRMLTKLTSADDAQQGYAELVAWGCTRTDTPEGADARAVAADLLAAAFPLPHGTDPVDWAELCGFEAPE